MTPTLLDFSRHTELAVEARTIAAVSAIAAPMDVPVLIVGAFARDLHIRTRFGMDPERVTEDIDLALAVRDWQVFDDLRERLIASKEFTGSARTRHTLRHVTGRAVDLVPFSGVETPERRIAWPPNNDFVMDVFGFQEALVAAHHVILPNNIPVKLISLPALAMLKLVTWKARHNYVPGKDAHDLMLIVGNYCALGNADRLWNEFVDWTNEDQFDYDLSGARMLGGDMHALLERYGVERVAGILVEEVDEESPGKLTGAMHPANPVKARNLLAALYRGLLEVQQK